MSDLLFGVGLSFLLGFASGVAVICVMIKSQVKQIKYWKVKG